MRKVAKFWVVPELSDRRATVIAVLGSLAFGFSAAIAGSSHFVIVRWKIFAIVGPDSWSFFTPLRLYDIVMGATTVGM